MRPFPEKRNRDVAIVMLTYDAQAGGAAIHYVWLNKIRKPFELTHLLYGFRRG
jgi:hypothetical protein